MEKIIYPVWKSDSESNEAFRDKLLQQLSPQLIELGVLKLRICVVDEDVAPAAGYRMEATRPAVSGIVSVWLNSSVYRQPIEQAIAEQVNRYSGYLVTESEPLVNDKHVAPEGQRTPGMNQVVFLQKPPRLSYAEWLDIWHNSHTQVAIDTQSTFGYRQNVVARPLVYASPACDAIIEENFPEAAISSRAAFYDAEGDEALFQQRQQEMIDSCVRFIDFDKIDCIPMSEYVMKA